MSGQAAWSSFFSSLFLQSLLLKNSFWGCSAKVIFSVLFYIHLKKSLNLSQLFEVEREITLYGFTMYLFPHVFSATSWMNFSVQMDCTQKQTDDFYKLQISALMQYFFLCIYQTWMNWSLLHNPPISRMYEILLSRQQTLRIKLYS